MRNRLNAAALESASERECIHADARKRSTVDINRIHAFGSHHAGKLFESAVDGRAFWRIDFHGNDEFLRLNFPPQRALWFLGPRMQSLGSRFNDGGHATALYQVNSFHCPSHGLNVIRRGPAATAQNARAKSDRLTSKKIEIFRRRFRIDHEIAGALRKSHV